MWNARPRVYHAQIHKRAMELALLFGRRRKVGFPAMVKQAGAGGKYRIKRQTCLLQSDGPKKSNIQVRTRSGSKAIRVRCLAPPSHKMCGTRAAHRWGV